MSDMTGLIICGPPPKCTCPAVAWWCVCGAWPAGVELAAELLRQDAEQAHVDAPVRGGEGNQ